MPTFRHGKGTRVLLSSYDVSTYLKEVTVPRMVEAKEITTFNTNEKSYIVGQADATVSANGLWEGSALGADEIFNSVISTDGSSLTIAPDNGLVIGNRCYLGFGEITSYDINMPVGDVVALNTQFQMSSGVHGGVILADGTALSTTTNGTSVDGGASPATPTTIGYTANLHVIANTRNGSTTYKIQHSTDNSTWVDLITFTAVSLATITSQYVEITTGTVNRYLRAQSTLSGSTGTISAIISISRS